MYKRCRFWRNKTLKVLLTYEPLLLLYYTESYAPKTGSFEKSKQHISDSMYDDIKASPLIAISSFPNQATALQTLSASSRVVAIIKSQNRAYLNPMTPYKCTNLPQLPILHPIRAEPLNHIAYLTHKYFCSSKIL